MLRNALIPAVTLLGLSVGYLMGGTVIVENVFSLPGAGKLLVDAISARDYPLVQSTTLVFAVLVILVNLGTDLDLHLPRSAGATVSADRMTPRDRTRQRRELGEIASTSAGQAPERVHTTRPLRSPDPS